MVGRRDRGVACAARIDRGARASESTQRAAAFGTLGQRIDGKVGADNTIARPEELYIPTEVQPISNDVKQMPCDIGEAKTTRHTTFDDDNVADMRQAAAAAAGGPAKDG